ncbi:MAG: response regulator [candidate division Zixibacteria bacterium]|nr:response regulator [Candidatus Tariuqbacter arcticus]
MNIDHHISKPRILVVDDDPAVREALEKNLAYHGYDFDSAKDGSEALDMIKNKRYAVGIYDILMPNIDGIELLALTNKIDRDMMVIMTTGKAQVEIVIETLKKGAFAFIRKPFSFDEIHAEIQKALKQRELCIENRDYHRNLEELVEQRTAELRKSKIELILEKEKLENVLESIGAGLQILNSRGDIIWKNRFVQKWFGAVDNWNRALEEQTSDSNLGKCSECDVVQNGEVSTHQFSFKCPDGKVREFLVNCTPIIGSFRKVVKVVSLIQDVTERNRIERDLLHSERLASMGEIAASLAHEINNPIGIILGLVQNILADLDKEHPLNEDLKIIETETLRTGRVIKSLLESAHEIPALKEEVDILEIWKSSLKFLDYTLKENKVAVVTRVDSELPPFIGNPEQLKQVLINILLNAINAMPEGGKIIFNADKYQNDSHRKSCLQIEIIDDGQGIEPGNIDKVFKPFYTSKGRKGTGLGLAISKRIIERHGGNIQIKSEFGKGTTCNIKLPI